MKKEILSRVNRIFIASVVFFGVYKLHAQDNQVLSPDHAKNHNIIANQKEKKVADNEIDFAMFNQTVIEGMFPPMGDALTKFTFPEGLNQLNEQSVVIVGYMLPYKHVDKMDEFMLMGQPLWACNFCDASWVKTAVLVSQRKEDVFPFDAVNPVRVEGKLKLWVKDSANQAHQEGFIYAIEDAVVTAYKVGTK